MHRTPEVTSSESSPTVVNQLLIITNTQTLTHTKTRQRHYFSQMLWAQVTTEAVLCCYSKTRCYKGHVKR